MKISHERYRAAKTAEAKAEWMAGFKTVIGEQSAIANHLAKAAEDLNPLKVLELFKRITAEVCCCHTAVLIYRIVNCLRCTLKLEGQKITFGSISRCHHQQSDHPWRQKQESECYGCTFFCMADVISNEDDLTAKLAEIVHYNRTLSFMMESGYGIEMTMANWEVLGQAVALYINSQAPGMSMAAVSLCFLDTSLLM
jgi:DNA-directed RNA polymerase III subunit RPC1